MMKVAETKASQLRVAAKNVENALMFQQEQHQMARDAVNDAYSVFLKALDDRRADTLRELDVMFTEKQVPLPTDTFTTQTDRHLFNGHCPGLTRYQKGKTNLDFLEQEIVSGSDISWTIRKSASRFRHITTPASLSFSRAGCPFCHATNSVKALKAPYVS